MPFLYNQIITNQEGQQWTLFYYVFFLCCKPIHEILRRMCSNVCNTMMEISTLMGISESLLHPSFIHRPLCTWNSLKLTSSSKPSLLSKLQALSYVCRDGVLVQPSSYVAQCQERSFSLNQCAVRSQLNEPNFATFGRKRPSGSRGKLLQSTEQQTLLVLSLLLGLSWLRCGRLKVEQVDLCSEEYDQGANLLSLYLQCSVHCLALGIHSVNIC